MTRSVLAFCSFLLVIVSARIGQSVIQFSLPFPIFLLVGRQCPSCTRALELDNLWAASIGLGGDS